MKEHTKFILDRKSFFGKAAVFCLLLSAVLRTAAALLNRAVFNEPFTLVETLLPICSCLLYVLFIFLFGRKGFFFSVIPFILGMLGMIMRLFSYDSLMQEQATVLHAFSAVLLCLILTAVYSATVFGGIRTKWLLPPLFAFAFLFHLFAEVYPVIRAGYRVAFPLILAEAGLCLIFPGMFFASLTMKKKNRPAGGLFHRGKKDENPSPAPAEEAAPATDAAPAAAASTADEQSASPEAEELQQIPEEKPMEEAAPEDESASNGNEEEQPESAPATEVSSPGDAPFTEGDVQA